MKYFQMISVFIVGIIVLALGIMYITEKDSVSKKVILLLFILMLIPEMYIILN